MQKHTVSTGYFGYITTIFQKRANIKYESNDFHMILYIKEVRILCRNKVIGEVE